MLQILAALKALAKVADFFQWAWKTFSRRRAETTHAQNASDIDAAIANALKSDSVSNPPTGESRTATPPAS